MKLPEFGTGEAELQPQKQQLKGTTGIWMKAAVITTALLWSLSVALPVWLTRSNESGNWEAVRGILPALLGWLGLLVLCPAWFANLLLVPLCIMLFERSRGGFPIGLVALALAGSAYFLPGIYGDNDEAVIVQRLIGFYLWLGAFLIITLAHAILSPPINRRWIGLRVAVVMLMVLGIASLEKVRPVGVNPLEASLKDPNDVASLTAVLARHPPQAEKDSALRWAIRQDFSVARSAPSKTVVMLIGAGANPNQTDGYGGTFLMEAVTRRGSEGLVKLLLQAGADVNATNSQGKTVLEVAREWEMSAHLQQVLIDAGAHTNGH